ncbi:hypothetical protein ESCO_002469 [Escovopsis weberi]|uniref:Uncharacterized protein n=1 Tax=Escovopsis weberi TaxID=150374 RepID=A0A0N0RT15_ESCWE|nr:hypothetical protein ESCO_002469 [Escovopsis weberi]
MPVSSPDQQTPPSLSPSATGSPRSRAPASASTSILTGGRDAGNRTVAAAAAAATATSSGAQVGHAGGTQGSQGHFIRRPKKWDHATARRSSRASPSARQILSDSSPETPVRRSSNLSDYTLSEARDIINPRPDIEGAEPDDPEGSPLASLSLAFALLPAVAGALFKNGSSVATDVMLLGLAAIFLHWVWYHAAQQVRVREEAELDSAIDDESDVNSSSTRSVKPIPPLEDVQEEEEAVAEEEEEEEEDDDDEKRAPPPKSNAINGAAKVSTTERQSAAVRELYRYEVLALLSCFAFPFLSAYLLHAIRSQLSRPSEGLVSNYNLTIFLMASELRVLSHLIKLVQSRTLHLQRIVHQSPYAVPIRTQLDRLVDRLERLEAMSLKEHMQVEQGAAFESTKASMTRDIRSTIQPELDALNRAVRRYEKKAALLQSQTDSKLSDVYERLDDAIAIATQASGDEQEHERASYLAWVLRPIKALFSFSLGTLWAILTLPFKPLLALFGRSRQPSASASQAVAARSYRNGKTPLSARHIGERVPTRLMKRC